MNEDSVIIDDDDVVMVEPVEINDDDTPDQQIIDIVDLDEEPLRTNGDTVNSSTTNNNRTVVDIDYDRESSFVRLLKNNTILNKIVQRCLNMKNNAGMSRVIHKTLLPLYKDADNKFKESEVFSTVLKTILQNLKADPDHKFLHIKSLCEELKSGKYRRKVPFITLTTDLKKNHKVHSENEESDTEIGASKKRKEQTHIQENVELDNNDDSEVTAATIRKKHMLKKLKEKIKRSRNSSKHNKRRKKRKTPTKKTDVINIDNSDECDDESIITLDADDESDGVNDVMLLVGKRDDNVNNETRINKTKKDSANNSEVEILSSQDLDDISNNSNKENSLIEKENDPTRSNNNQLAPQSLDKSTSHLSRKTSQCVEVDNQGISSDDDSRPQTDDNRNIQNTSEKEITRPPDDLLVPQNSVEFEEHNTEFKARKIEEQIKYCKKMIVELEEKEVTNNVYQRSPYVQCDKFKAKIVELYKKLCKITGSGDGNLMKQRVVRLQVTEGHPVGPVRCLEQFLNESIDETGAVPLPDFHDVLECVTMSNIKDQLGWNRQQIMREALALFTHCGNALRKNRQRREYKDLLSLVRDKSQDDYDPANDDPLLLAKLEENKLIAKAKESEILEWYSRLEYSSKNSGANLESVKVTRKRPDDSESDSTSDEESTARKRLKTNTILKHNNVINGSLNIDDTIPLNNIEIMKNPLHNVLSYQGTKFQIPTPKELNTKAPIQNTLIIRTAHNTFNVSQNNLNPATNSKNPESFSFCTSIQNIIDVTTTNTLNSIANPNKTIQHLKNPNIQKAINEPKQNELNTTHNTKNTINATRMPTLHLNPVKEHTATNQIAWPGTLQKIGGSNRYVVAFNGKNTSITEPEKLSNSKYIENNTDTSEINKDIVVSKDSDTPILNIGNDKVVPNGANTATSDIGNETVVCNDANITTSDIGKGKVVPNDANITTSEIGNDTVVRKDANIPTSDSGKCTVICNDANTTKSEIRNDTVVHNDANITTSEIRNDKVVSNDSNIPASDIRNDKVVSNDSNISSSDIRNDTVVSNNLNILQNTKTEKTGDTNSIENNVNTTENQENIIIKKEQIKEEPVDIQTLLDSLGDNYISTVFDIEDPFLVIDISSDSSDDDEL